MEKALPSLMSHEEFLYVIDNESVLSWLTMNQYYAVTDTLSDMYC